MVLHSVVSKTGEGWHVLSKTCAQLS